MVYWAIFSPLFHRSSFPPPTTSHRTEMRFSLLVNFIIFSTRHVCTTCRDDQPFMPSIEAWFICHKCCRMSYDDDMFDVDSNRRARRERERWWKCFSGSFHRAAHITHSQASSPHSISTLLWLNLRYVHNTASPKLVRKFTNLRTLTSLTWGRTCRT